MNTEWLNLRPYNGDIKNGFEELVCQLARAEKIEDKKQFIRVAAPDGGVEAYCVLNNGDEYGWQAKFFSSFGNSQWKQIEESFKTAFDKHPKLIKYYICTPLDRQDPRIAKQGKRVKSLMDVWNDKITEWQSFADSHGRSIEFEYWGNSELMNRISKNENSGKLHYWFGKEEFSDNWFNQKLEESVSSLGHRYTPEINFDLPITNIFDGLSRDNHFKIHFLNHLDDLLKKHKKAISNVKLEVAKELVQETNNNIDNFINCYNQIVFEEITQIKNEYLVSLLNVSIENIDSLVHKLYDIDFRNKEEQKKQDKYFSDTNAYGWEIDSLRNLRKSITHFIDFLNGPIVSLSNNPFLFFKGEAGIGKSHLLADVAKKREARNLFTLLILGQQFSTTEDPWSQIRKILQIECSRDVFLDSINTKAESTGSRILIFIDAINEGEGKSIWQNNIASFIEVVKRFKNLGVVFSFRTSYEKLLIPEAIRENHQTTEITHHGFANHEYEASKLFFQNYKIKQPSTPILNPEFANPLFLKLFCEGLWNSNQHEIPKGYYGISTIIDNYLETVNNKISIKHNQPVELKLVQAVVREIASFIVESNKSYINFNEAFLLITTIKETNTIIDKSQFFHDLISEGLLSNDVFFNNDYNQIEGIYIAYERLGDHLITAQLLKNYLNINNPAKSFKRESFCSKHVNTLLSLLGFNLRRNRLFEIVKNEYTAYNFKGIIEAMSIQLPELINHDLYELAYHAKSYDPLITAFIDSIVWRKNNTFNDKQKEYINTEILQNEIHTKYFFEKIILVTSQPDNYFNSDFLHKYLMQFTMAERDAFWTQLIHYWYPSENDNLTSVHRLIEWALSEDDKKHISDESIRLMSQTLIWFHTSSNRILRDSATKAAICLLEDRIDVLINLIETFKSVNDPYVLQRVYAIAFGCAVRTSQTQHLKQLGDKVYSCVFDTSNVVSDILLRDYAKGIIEFAIYQGSTFEFSTTKIYPPFKSELPTEFPSNSEIDLYKLSSKSPQFKKYHYSQNDILKSMVTEFGRGTGAYGDFGRYVFSSALSNWKVDVNGLSNLGVKWIFEKYGYNVESHGEFDLLIGTGRGRSNVKEERIGKKYQWIAFHELLAKVSDNYNFYEDPYITSSKIIPYEGPWDPFIRDIDPTILIKENPKDDLNTYYWDKILYSNWDIPNKDWINDQNDLPSPDNLIRLKDESETNWLILDGFKDWMEPTPLGEEKYKSPLKRLGYNINSIIVHKENFKSALNYIKSNGRKNYTLNNRNTRYEMFSREYFWSNANRSYHLNNQDEIKWENLFHHDSGKYICDFTRTSINYQWQKELDGSVNQTISFYKPTELIFNLLKLVYSYEEGKYLNPQGELVCFDPCIQKSTTSCLLIRENDLTKMLKENDLEIIWISSGEKIVIGGDISRDNYFGRLNIASTLYFEKEKLTHTTIYNQESISE